MSERLNKNSKQIIDSFLEDNFLTKISTKLKNNLNKYSLLININLNEFIEQHLNNEEINNCSQLIFGLGKTSKLNKNTGNTKVCDRI